MVLAMRETGQALFRWTGPSGLSLVASVFGDPNSPPIVFVHGGGQSRHAWRRTAQAAAAAGYFALAVDQRGHGDSEWDDGGDYSPTAIAGDLQVLLCLLGRPAVVVGASRGGYAALLAASEAGRKARALVLVEIAPKIDQSGAAQVRWFMQSSTAGFADIDEAVSALESYRRDGMRKDPEQVRRSMRRSEDGRWYWRWDPRLANGTAAAAERLESELSEAASRLTCPLLLIRGEHSNIVREEHAAHLKSLVSGVRIVSIPGAGHMVSGEDNDPFDAAILEFLRELAHGSNLEVPA